MLPANTIGYAFRTKVPPMLEGGPNVSAAFDTIGEDVGRDLKNEDHRKSSTQPIKPTDDVPPSTTTDPKIEKADPRPSFALSRRKSAAMGKYGVDDEIDDLLHSEDPKCETRARSRRGDVVDRWT